MGALCQHPATKLSASIPFNRQKLAWGHAGRATTAEDYCNALAAERNRGIGLIQPPQEETRWTENRFGRQDGGNRPSQAVHDIYIGSPLLVEHRPHRVCTPGLSSG